MLGITLYRLRDPRLPNTNSAIRIDCADDGRKGKLDEPIKLLLCRLDPHNEISVDAIRDYYTILAASLITIEQKSIVVTNPEMVAEWHPTLNLPLTPNKVMSGMGIKVWWKCNKCGNDYQAFVYSRKEGNGCPKCAINTRSAARTSAALKTNSLVEKYPELVEEISIADNPGIDVARLATGSKKHIVWQCKKCGNKWSAAINHRANGVGCPRCARQNTTNAAKRAVINLDTGEEYESLKEAAMACGGDKRSIDSTNVFKFIGISPVPIPNKRKGKLKMKALFRMKGRGSAYHEGSRAENLIKSLDMNKIILCSSIPFNEIEKTILDLRK